MNLINFYPWLLVGHLISVISWMAGLLYLPRLFVYHCAAKKGSVQSKTFQVMEHRLLRYIMNPSMAGAWLFGGLMVLANPVHMHDGGWFHTKMTLVLLLSVFHMALAKWRRLFANDHNTKTEKFYRIVNEIPSVFMVLIVILVIVKPF